MEKENYNQIVFTAVRDNLAAIFNIRKFLPSEKFPNIKARIREGSTKRR